MKKGFSLLETIIGTALMLLVFFGIFTAYQLGIKMAEQSERRIIATAIASGELEKIRNLPYQSIGTIGANLPFSQGILDSATTTVFNNTEYTIETQVKYIIDEADGTGGDDSCNWDYKKAEIKISWAGKFSGEVKLTTDIAPKDKIEEIQTCQIQPGGIISVSVFDAFGIMVPSPLIEVFNPTTSELIDSSTPVDGKYDFPLATSTYKIVISKTGYSSERTYGAEEVAIPGKPHPLVLEGQITPISFSIDKISAFSIDTFSPWGTDYFSDSFLDETKISQKTSIEVANGEVNLASTTEGYSASGYLISIPISPSNLQTWDEFSWTDSEPSETSLKYQIYYFSGTDWYLIPDSDLTGNSIGLDNSPIDLSSLATTTYSQMKLKGEFASASTTTTPILYDWQVSWITDQATPIPDLSFHLQGAKIIGKDADENPVYKYSQNKTSDSSGHINIPDLEWDSYTFSSAEIGLDLLKTEPSPQPIGLSPDTVLSVKLYFEAQNSLLLTIQDIETLNPIFSARARLYNSGLGYDKTQYTDEKGQTIFIPLEPATYTLEVQAPSYSPLSTTVSISGDNIKTVKLQRIE
jgi:type II secretory pathway pseudopilin PulG